VIAAFLIGGLAPLWLKAAVVIYKDGYTNQLTGGVVYAGTDDNWLYENFDQNGNMGGRADGEIGSRNFFSPPRRRWITRFDLSSFQPYYDPADMVSVTLRMYVGFVDIPVGTTNTVQVFAMTPANAGWVEGTDGGGNVQIGSSSWGYHTTYSQGWAGGAGAGLAGTDYYTPAAATNTWSSITPSGYMDLVFTDPTIVSNWFSSTNPGMILIAKDEPIGGANSLINFRSANDPTTTQRPELIIQYVPEPATGLLTGAGLAVMMIRRRRKP
jgi:hypothetical protein